MTAAPTPLDAAHAAMETGGDAAERAFFARLADTEMFLLLKDEPKSGRIAPRVFPLDEGPVVLAFDREDRLSGFAAGPAPYAALSGRALVRMLVQGAAEAECGAGGAGALGLGLNLGHPSAMVLPADGVAWLAAALDVPVTEDTARLTALDPPRGLPDALLEALDRHLARMAGLARRAWLAGAGYDGGSAGHLLAFEDIAPGAEATLARATAEALRFSGLEAGALDVVFPAPESPIWARLERVALRFDLPDPPKAEDGSATPVAPGSDPAKPPRLR